MAVPVGVRDLFYAILEKDDNTSITYKKPVRMAKAIEVKISPSTEQEVLYADDSPSEVANTFGECSMEINCDDLTIETQAQLLGHTIVNGVLKKNKDDLAPYVAVGFRSIKSNKKYRYFWMLKGKFSLPKQELKTQEGSPEFQTPTIEGSFLPRDFDGNWQFAGDEDSPEFTQGATWFNEVVADKPKE
ncbi:major tail protein [Thermoactinomyces sp. DSM 45892]|uniref:major tail protein n=1 Tax=Thermoactinomyces sp. DSM 45892 TaxID=1882753 RepID=UPI00089C78CD|nr:major tail protein [Thermoactinomyces sp. DSM 45892]SDY69518.1 phage major tail protein, phi13 family [Thermoactinomyces sp. DSM 45892]